MESPGEQLPRGEVILRPLDGIGAVGFSLEALSRTTATPTRARTRDMLDTELAVPRA